MRFLKNRILHSHFSICQTYRKWVSCSVPTFPPPLTCSVTCLFFSQNEEEDDEEDDDDDEDNESEGSSSSSSSSGDSSDSDSN